jgi:hypothetical protein
MKKNLFKITEQEKKKILENHNSLKESSKYNGDINLLFEDKPKPTTQTTDLPAWTKDYPCLSDYGKLENTNDTTDNKQVYTKGTGTKSFHYNKDFSFVYVSGSDKIKGTWKCVNGKLLITTPSDKEQWTKDKGWHKIPVESKFTKCDEKLPIKQWCKNETIKKVQACMKMPIEWQTGNFGRYTKGYLESRGQNGKTITIDTIKNVCGDNHPLVTSLAGAGGSTGTGTGGSTGTGTTGTGATGTGAGGTSNTGAGGTPSQTKISAEYYNDYEVDEVEASAQTTYDGYSEEEPTQPKSTSSNLNASNRKSSYNRQNLADYGNFLNNQ